ncbi:ABC transporter permease [Bacillus badius]|uniref:ABC transporter, permease protein n=1 Tax=Bacillus badius TaxID=1455 RepID=A0ABR5AZS2_BACBA|nr:FtsX-like permease family protein [Bacillus badius]KIL73206.1 ABC transporter, permease protein [Bacillus badius]KIL80218.1 ABC transporter, permease protein [Bacillus badius]KZR56855.1 ABC transporter permease [Bacillus badius]MED4717006.1 ABC transporter permease [Bacillus badius]
MYFRIIGNDILKNKMITLVTMIFVAAAAMLVSLAAILTINLSGALDTLMTKSKTPHFLQMHSGEIDHARLTSFAEKNSNVDKFQVIEFLNIDGSEIILGENSLVDSVQDNGFSTQSEQFDYLLDLDGNIINVSEGELYVPISYMRDNITKVGDKAVISGQEFVVAGFLRDSQMNSTLSASKRFLVSENDYEKMKNLGSIEHLIEFRLKDLSALGEFETAYAAAELEANGPTVTYTLFKMMNALSDGMMIAVILFVSALVVAITFICIRFTLLSKMEDDYHEIGVMKAIGLRISDIKRIYLVKYVAIATVGSILGFGLSILFKGILLENIRLYMGEAENSSFAILFGIIGILLVLFSILLYVNGVLKHFRKISVVEAIRFGTSQEKSSGAKRFCLNRNWLFNTNIFLGIKDVLTRKKLYATMLAVLVVSSFIIIVPQNLYNTISSKSFTQYMGIGDYDMRIDIQQTSNISEKTDEILKEISNDRAISNYAALTTKIFKAKMEDGTEENLKVELGDHSAFPIAYSGGKAPVQENEIALSSINADELNKKIGDRITLVIEGEEKDFSVSGIYSDITNGGKTAKAVFTDNSADIMWSIIIAELSDTSMVDNKISEYLSKFGYAKISNVDEFVTQTFGSTIRSVETASYAAVAVSLIITVLITLLFMKLLIAKDRTSIAAMKALGFTKSDIRIQYMSRSVFVLIIGIVLGTLLANTLGELLAGAIISSFGADSFKFTVNPLSAYLLCPLMMVCAVLIATVGGTSGAGQIKISENIKG